MVKPTLNPKPDGGEKDEIKKEKDIEAALKGSGVESKVHEVPEASVSRAQPRRRCSICCTMLVLLLCIILAIGTFFTYTKLKNKDRGFRCGVIYNGYEDYKYKDYVIPSYQEFQEQWCGENVDIDVAGGLETIDKPEDEFSERLTIMHDYKVNFSAYHLLQSQICYIKAIDPEVIANPQEFWDNIQDSGFLNHHFEMLYETYVTVEPAISNLDSLGPNIAYLCKDVPTYWIEKLPPITFHDFLNMFINILTLDYDSYTDVNERVQRDVGSVDGIVSKIRTFDGKFVCDLKVLPPKVIKKLKESDKLPEKYQKFVNKANI